ncbi:hypothetical protein BCR33DRAFT_713869 [Rhizoclosmatium globosum]|uniref:C3H1-type domain-containing protein n=1 Tax=Rhizoclosmatium globosum TaxID=329046 RepID=A0A1Y2CRH4_9FUNG|nr:hypothetical protein BCR33DRAFT_713869 [Rhizoclosmatium globosum]|eukprot:ORY49557.1 hypothetical protein BCR33DRAFT_713869 [Rhizoclosmatium globosum]
MPHISEMSDSDDDMPGLVEVEQPIPGATRTQTNEDTVDSDDDSDFDDSDMPDLVDAPAEVGGAVSSGIDDDDDDDDDDMPALVDAPGTSDYRFAKTMDAIDSDDDDDDDDDMPELVDLDPSANQQSRYKEYTGDEDDEDEDYSQPNSSSSYLAPRSAPKYGDQSDLFQAAATCCNKAQLHVLGLCQSPLVSKLVGLINERKSTAQLNVEANKQMNDAEARLMDTEESMTAEEQAEVEKLIDDSWDLIGNFEKKLVQINEELKKTDLEFIEEIKRAHNRLQQQFGRYKNGAMKTQKAKAEMGRSARMYQQYNGRKGHMTEEVSANMLGLLEIDQALKTLVNAKFRSKYLLSSSDITFSVKRRSPKYGDKSDPEVREIAQKKQEPVWSIMARSRTGGLQRYNSNPNRIQRVILLEYPTQPTCPEVTITDTAEGRYVSISWGVSLSEERQIDKCEVSMRVNGGLWGPIWSGDVNSCVVTIEEYGLLSFRIRAHNELGWGVYSYIRDVNIAKWKLPVKNSHNPSASKKSKAGETVASVAAGTDVDAALTSLKEKISAITSANPNLESRHRVLTELIGTLPAITRHHQHLPILTRHVAGVIQATEQAMAKAAKQITNEWRIKLTAFTNEILKTPDESFTSPRPTWTTRSEFSDLIEGYVSNKTLDDDSLELTSQSRNQIWQAISGMYTKRPIKLIPTVITSANNKGGVPLVSGSTAVTIVTPGLAVLRKLDRVLQAYVEAADAGVFAVSNTGVKEWADVVSKAVGRAIEREEVKADEVQKAERQRVEQERIEAEEREMKERARIEAELRRRAAAEEKERVLIAKRLEKEEAERREAQMREEMEAARVNEAAAREKEYARQRALEESRAARDEMMRRQTPGFGGAAVEQHHHESAKPAIKVVKVPRQKPSASSLNEVPSVPPSVERLEPTVNRTYKFGSHGDEEVAVAAPSTKQTTCKFFNTPKGCRNGDNCKNLHVAAVTPAAESTEAPVASVNEAVEVCKFFNSRMGCRFGDKCRHAHIEGQRPPRPQKKVSREVVAEAVSA